MIRDDPCMVCGKPATTAFSSHHKDRLACQDPQHLSVAADAWRMDVTFIEVNARAHEMSSGEVDCD